MLFKKVGEQQPFQIGQNGDRFLVEQLVSQEKGETVGTLNIMNVNRSDDGLYECIAVNGAGTAYKNGHITVKFPPTFEKTKDLPPVWSWNNKPGNLSCLPEAIPNATITWKFGEDLCFICILFRKECSLFLLFVASTYYIYSPTGKSISKVC